MLSADDIEAELAALEKDVRADRERRRGLRNTAFILRADGVRLRPALGDERRFPLPEEAIDVIQVYGEDADGEVLMATHLMRYSCDGDPVPTTGVVNCGRHWFRLSIEVRDSVWTCGFEHRLRWSLFPFSSHWRPLLLASATVTVTVIGLWIGDRTFTRRDERTASTTDLVLPGQPGPELRRSYSVPGPQGEGVLAPDPVLAPEPRLVPPWVAAPTQPSTQAPALGVAATTVLATLVPGISRSVAAEQANLVELSAATRTVTLELLTTGADVVLYDAVVQNATGQSVVRLAAQSSQLRGSGQTVVPLTLPADLLSPGVYFVRLTGPAKPEVPEGTLDYRFTVAVQR